MNFETATRCLELNRGKGGVFVRIDRRARKSSTSHFGRGKMVRMNGHKCVVQMFGSGDEILAEPEYLKLWHAKNVENGIIEPQTDANSNIIETTVPPPATTPVTPPTTATALEVVATERVAGTMLIDVLPPVTEPEPEETEEKIEPARPAATPTASTASPALSGSLADKLRQARELIEQVKREGLEKLRKLFADKSDLKAMITELDDEINLLVKELNDAGVDIPVELLPVPDTPMALTPGQKAAATRRAIASGISPPGHFDPLTQNIQQRVLDFLRENEGLWLKSTEIMEGLGIDVDTPSMYLRPLVDQGKVERQGTKGSTKYRYASSAE